VLLYSTVTATAAVAAGGAAAALIPGRVAVLAEGVVKGMFMTKIKLASAALLLALVGIGSLGAGGFLHRTWADKQGTTTKEGLPLATGKKVDEGSGASPRQEQPEGISNSQKSRPREPKDTPALGYRWVMEPQDGRGLSWAIGRADGKGIVAIEEKDQEGALLLTLAHPPATNRAGLVEFRPVAFDAHGNRYVLDRITGCGTGQVAMDRFRLDPKKLAAEKVKRLGVELLTPEGVQLIARQAMARAKKEGVEILPPPQVGTAYEFVLTKLDGRKVRSKELRGQVVILYCWSCT